MQAKQLLFACAAALVLVSCSKNSSYRTEPRRNVKSHSTSVARTNIYSGGNVTAVTYCGEPDTTLLLAGQTIPVGYVISGNDGSNTYVTYVCTNGWSMEEVHLFYGEATITGIPLRVNYNFIGMPVNNSGNPVLGQFPVVQTFSNHPTSYTVAIPEALPMTYEMPLAAHAVVTNGSQTETAWGQGEPVTLQGSWAMYFWYVSSVCE